MLGRLAVVWVALAVVAWYIEEPVSPSPDQLREHFAPGDAAYTPADIHSPRLVGWPLQIFAFALRVPMLGSALARALLNENRIYRVRQYASLLEAWPMYYPLHEASVEEYAQHSSLREAAKPVEVAAEKPEGVYGRWTVSDYHRAFQGGKTPVDVARAVLQAVKDSAVHRGVNAFAHVDEKDVIRQAEASAARWRAKKPLGPFDGVPIAVKTEIDVKGHNTTQGTTFLHLARGWPAPVDSAPVARMRAAGAVIVGVTHMHEIGLGTTGHNAHLEGNGPRNPWNLGHYPGGSSAGSAAAVAAGIVPVAIGADGGGSIRIPASLCGVVGLKSTFGRVPSENNLDWSVGHVGPLAATVRDAALAYEVLAGADVKAMPPSKQPPAHLSGFNKVKDLSDVRLCVMADFNSAAEQAQRDALAAVLAALQKRGAKVRNVVLPQLDVMQQAHGLTILSELALSQDPHNANVSMLGAETQVALLVGRHFSARDLLAAQKVRGHLFPIYRALFRDCDAVVTPTTGLTAPVMPKDAEVAGESNLRVTALLMPYVVLGNFLGFPAIAVPTGRHDTRNLPTSVQLYANHWNEHVLLRLARAVEADARSPSPPTPQAFHSPLPLP